MYPIQLACWDSNVTIRTEMQILLIDQNLICDYPNWGVKSSAQESLPFANAVNKRPHDDPSAKNDLR